MVQFMIVRFAPGFLTSRASVCEGVPVAKRRKGS